MAFNYSEALVQPLHGQITVCSEFWGAYSQALLGCWLQHLNVAVAWVHEVTNEVISHALEQVMVDLNFMVTTSYIHFTCLLFWWVKSFECQQLITGTMDSLR
ncbi:hypothetical protein D3C87_1787920 [compost metagenome]